MADLSQRVARQRAESQGTSAPVGATSTPVGHTRRPAKITANNTDGTYTVDVYDDAGNVVLEDELVIAFPASATALAVDTWVWIDYPPGRPKGVLDATAYAIGGAGGGGAIIVVGAPGFLSGT